MSVFENWLLRREFELKRDAVTASGENYIMRNLVISTPHPGQCGYKIEKNEIVESCSAYGKWRSLDGILVWKPERKVHWVESGVDGRMMLRWIYVFYTQ